MTDHHPTSAPPRPTPYYYTISVDLAVSPMVREKVVETCVAYAAAFLMLSSLTWLGIGFGLGLGLWLGFGLER